MENDILSIIKAITEDALSASQEAKKIEQDEERTSKKRKHSKISVYDGNNTKEEKFDRIEILAEIGKLKKTVNNQKETIKQQAFVISQMLDNQRKQKADNNSQPGPSGDMNGSAIQQQRYGSPVATKEDIMKIENQLERITAAASWMYSEIIYLEKLYENEKIEKQRWKSIATKLRKENAATNLEQNIVEDEIIDLTGDEVYKDDMKQSQMVEDILNRAIASSDGMKQSQIMEEDMAGPTVSMDDDMELSEVIEKANALPKVGMKQSQTTEEDKDTICGDQVDHILGMSEKMTQGRNASSFDDNDETDIQILEESLSDLGQQPTVSADPKQQQNLSNDQQNLHYVTLDEIYTGKALNCTLLTSQTIFVINKIIAATKENWNIFFNSNPMEYLCIEMKKLFQRSDFMLRLTGKLVCNAPLHNKKRIEELSDRIQRCTLTHLQLCNQIINFVTFQKLVLSKTILNFSFKNVTVYGEYEQVLEIDDILKEIPLVEHFEYCFKYYNEVTYETAKLLLPFPQLKNLKTFKLCNISRMFDLDTFAVFVRRHTNVKFILEYRWQQETARNEIRKIARKLIIPSTCAFIIQFAKK